MDSVSLRATKQGDHTGPNPTDRSKHGSKLHLAVDGTGIPLGLLLTAANPNDSMMLEPLPCLPVPTPDQSTDRPAWD